MLNMWHYYHGIFVTAMTQKHVAMQLHVHAILLGE